MGVTRDDLEARDRLLAAELLAKADARTEERIVSAVDAVTTTVSLKIGALRWQMIAALVGGQTLAGVAAAYMTGHGSKVEQLAASVLPFV